jgi:hypothetical protein
MGNPHPVHGMIEVTPPLVPTTMRPHKLKGRWFYSLNELLRSAHLIPTTTGSFYINNYIDWDQYQVLYEDDWEAQGIKRATNFEQER